MHDLRASKTKLDNVRFRQYRLNATILCLIGSTIMSADIYLGNYLTASVYLPPVVIIFWTGLKAFLGEFQSPKLIRLQIALMVPAVSIGVAGIATVDASQAILPVLLMYLYFLLTFGTAYFVESLASTLAVSVVTALSVLGYVGLPDSVCATPEFADFLTGAFIFIIFLIVFSFLRYQYLTHKLSLGITALSLEERNSESALLSNMSHELRNPLNGVVGMLKDIERTADDNLYLDVLYSAKIALASTTHLSQIVDDILDYKQLHDGSLVISPASIDLHETHLAQLPLWRFMAYERGCAFETDVALSDLPRFVLIDEKRFNQIKFNLISNAIKFCDDGEVRQSLSFTDGKLTLKITDTGIGMTPETLEKIFGRFQQADASIGKKYGGTGLGLSITLQIIQKMGGTLDVESELGKGTTMTVTLPAPVDTARSESPVNQVLADSASLGDSDVGLNHEYELDELKVQRILCVDDNRMNLAIASKLLERKGAQVVTALSGRIALEHLDQQSFDIILSDISMPEMTGEELFAEIRAQEIETPVIAVTGNVLPEDVDRYLALGFEAVVGKPVDQEKLLRVISRTISSQTLSVH